MPLTANQILKAAVVPGKANRVYCIGSFALKVNFLAQQRRALNLIWALHERGRLELSPRVAVIGGGLAGVTAAGALLGYGAKVDLFEKGGRVLHRQRKTSHRRVHPTINSWPHEAISVTTNLPFYDWAAGFCSEVAEDIARHFEKAMEDRRYNIYYDVTARDMAPIGTKLIRVVTDKPLEEVEGYDLVIITIGFGDEVKQKNFESKTYWENDNLEMERDGGGASQDFVVSGCGDGGLIDALRIVHVDFGEGLLAFELASQLSGTQIATAIRLAEDAAAAGTTAVATRSLAKSYKKMAGTLINDPLYAEIHKRLARSMKKFTRIVYLGDRALSEPYSIKSAPIHKLMIAHIMETSGKIKYEPREVTSEDKREEVKLGQYRFDYKNTKVVIRHGAKTEFKNLLGDHDLSALRRKQEKLKDRCAEQAWSEDYEYPTPLGWTPDRSSREYTRVRRDMAQRAFKMLIPDASVVDRPGKFRVELEAPPPPCAPRTMFRVPVEYVVEAESDAL